ncbi:MAG: rRNA maturation RNase YbeY [Planctomycetales bacterium]|nr:rRNA maturation RNase YbeY [Planctomycetales bacterium]
MTNIPRIELDIGYHDSRLPQDEQRFTQAARWIADRGGWQRLFASIAIVDDATMQQLNSQRLGHDWPTDVISFVLDGQPGAVEGEVIASAETAERTSARVGTTAGDELLLYVVHGLLHVAGLDDITPEQALAMRRAEQECLRHLGVPSAAEHLHRWHEIEE